MSFLNRLGEFIKTLPKKSKISEELNKLGILFTGGREMFLKETNKEKKTKIIVFLEDVKKEIILRMETYDWQRLQKKYGKVKELSFKKLKIEDAPAVPKTPIGERELFKRFLSVFPEEKDGWLVRSKDMTMKQRLMAVADEHKKNR
jgi:hypothetical protein